MLRGSPTLASSGGGCPPRGLRPHDVICPLGHRLPREPLSAAPGAAAIAATSNIDCREGDWHPTRIVMLEFPSMEKARAWYDSPEYQEVLPIRLDANRDKMVMFEGLP